MDTYSKQLETRNRAVVFRDYNIDLLSPERTTSFYTEGLEQCGYKLMNQVENDYSTRTTSTSATIIDHVSTNLKNHQFHLAIIDSAMSDHKQLYFEIKKYKQNAPSKIRYEAINYDKLYETMIGDSSNEDYGKLEEKLISCVNKSRVTKIKISNPPRRDWINKDIIKEINERNRLWMKYKANPNR